MYLQFPAIAVSFWYDVGADPDGIGPANPADREVVASGSGQIWTGVIPASDPEIREGATVRVVVDVDNTLHYLDGPETSGGSSPWQWRVIIEQEGRITVRNNVINPDLGDTAYVSVKASPGDRIKVIVYDLAGNPVKKLSSGNSASGVLQASWDGRSGKGKKVAPGVYYVVIWAGGKRQARKILVTR
jgi:hypothetical protein